MTSIFLPELNASVQRYDITRSYEWNYENAPSLPENYVLAPSRKEWQLCGVNVNSPVSIAAGPLLNGRWVLHYASLGFDVLTYKTVRSMAWPCYPTPNLQPIRTVELNGPTESPLQAAETMLGSWAVSFGMPSKTPDLWRFDVEETRRLLPQKKRLSVSVVATPTRDWTIDEVAEDFAKCAYWAVESGADFVELNFSCPNVATCDGQLYQNVDQAQHVAKCTRDRVGNAPLLIKIGQVADQSQADSLVNALSDVANALVMINCIRARVQGNDGLLFDGQQRGIAGPAIRSAVLDQISMFRRAIVETGSPLEVVGVGGLTTVENFKECLARGATGVQIATSAMNNSE